MKKIIEKEIIECITYGHRLREEEFEQVKNIRFDSMNKPKGGVWSSPIRSNRSWKRFCEIEDFHRDGLKFGTKFSIPSSTKLMIVDSKEDYESCLKNYGRNIGFGEIPWSEDFGWTVIDYDKLLEDGYKGLWLTEKGLLETSYHLPLSKHGGVGFSTWSCETILIFDFSILQDITYF